jgi:hypothetical protein
MMRKLTTRMANPCYSYEIYDETGCREFLRKYYDEDTVEVFDNLERLNSKHSHQFRSEFLDTVYYISEEVFTSTWTCNI